MNLYQSYSSSNRKILDESRTIKILDNSNGTKYFKKYESGEMTAEDIAQKNHEEGLHYEVTILEEDRPISFLEVVHENSYIGVTFLDEDGRKYLKYQYKEAELLKKLFLREVWFYHFNPDDRSVNEEYRLHFAFDQDGNVSYRKYDEINKKAADYESKEPLDVSGLYEDYPEFGHYEGLIRIERNMELLDNINNI